MANNETFVQKVLFMYAEIAQLSILLKVTSMRELAPGVVASQDEYYKESRRTREFHIYFDPLLWGYKRPDVWGTTTPPFLSDRGILLLSGEACVPLPTDYKDVLDFAMEELVPRIAYLRWNALPIAVRLSP